MLLVFESQCVLATKKTSPGTFAALQRMESGKCFGPLATASQIEMGRRGDSVRSLIIKTKITMKDLSLAALDIEQRKVSLALFSMSHLDEIVEHHIPADLEKALAALAGFLCRAVEVHKVQHLALRSLPYHASRRLCEFHERCRGVASMMGLPVTEVSESDLFSGLGYPALVRRAQLRVVGKSIWPILASKGIARSSVDAAVLGLHVQIGRILNRCEVEP